MSKGKACPNRVPGIRRNKATETPFLLYILLPEKYKAADVSDKETEKQRNAENLTRKPQSLPAIWCCLLARLSSCPHVGDLYAALLTHPVGFGALSLSSLLPSVVSQQINVYGSSDVCQARASQPWGQESKGSRHSSHRGCHLVEGQTLSTSQHLPQPGVLSRGCAG